MAQAYIIESLTKVINFAFAFVPGTIGVYEGGTEVILQALGFAAATGVALALVRKAGNRFLDFYRAVYTDLANGCQMPGDGLLDRSPRLRKTYGQSGTFKHRSPAGAHGGQCSGNRRRRAADRFHCWSGSWRAARTRQARSKYWRGDHGARLRLAWVSAVFVLCAARFARR